MKLTIAKKIWLLASSIILGTAVLAAGLMALERSLLLDERQNGVRQAVEVAFGVVEHYQRLIENGKISEVDAKRAALDQIRGMRYGKGEYLWVNDMGPRMLMHPIKPELDGTDLSNNADPAGKRLFVSFVDEVRKQGAGFVFYLWPKPGNDIPVQKVSYVKGFTPWGWVIGSGVYLDTVDDIFWGRATNVGAVVAFLSMGLLVLCYLIVRSITLPLNAAVAIAERVASGDLSSEIEATDTDEAGRLLVALKNMNANLVKIVERVRVSAEAVLTGTSEIAAGNSDLSHRTEEQAASLDGTAANMEKITTAAHFNADNAKQAELLAKSASEVAVKGGRAVGEVVATMNSINESSKKIGDLIDVINGIAFQINFSANWHQECAVSVDIYKLRQREIEKTMHGIRPSSKTPSVILIVDDQQSSRVMLEGIACMVDAEAEIHSFASPTDALFWSATHVVDIALIDYSMPQMNGVQLAAKLKQIHGYSSVPLVMVTVNDETKVRYDALDAGVADFLQKPLDVRECTVRCKNLLGMRWQHRALEDKRVMMEGFIQESLRGYIERESDIVECFTRVVNMTSGRSEYRPKIIASISSMIASEIGMNSEYVKLIELVSPLCDVGDTLVDATDCGGNHHERVHSLVTELFRGLDSKAVAMAAMVTSSFRVRFDGKGIPGGLANDRIPLPARIVAVADRFESLLFADGEAPHFDQAFARIAELANTDLDARIVNKFFSRKALVISRVNAILDTRAEALKAA